MIARWIFVVYPWMVMAFRWIIVAIRWFLNYNRNSVIEDVDSDNEESYHTAIAKCCWPHAQLPIWSTTTCRLSATANSIYSRLTTRTGCCSSIRNLRTGHAVETGTYHTRTINQGAAPTGNPVQDSNSKSD
ncbi:hypothetical protein L798_13166 [Zootermopsis nevadensis]|uniref:Uncharacterized protein n=1 Tax=Zootermopsis nevadensis TaxID=136037 RepID=A0A067QUX0_ZOONE|nr:hypothetical protein L798_13166 [Zootermopsis nevadensis]